MLGQRLIRWFTVALVLIGIAIPSQQASSQIYYTVAGGNGSTRTWGQYIYPNPLQDYWWCIRSHFIIRASELQSYGVSPGLIESLAFNVRNSAPFTARRAELKIALTTATTVTSPVTDAGMTRVWTNGTYQVPLIVNTPTWVEYKFSTPFQWDGTSNIRIDFCTYRGGYVYVFPEYEYTQPIPTYAVQGYSYGDGVDFCPGSRAVGLYSVRPVVRLGVLAGVETSFPDDVDPRRILRAGSVYDGSSSAFPKPSLSFRQSTNQNINLTYKIVGPLPSTNVIYTATQNGNTTIAHTTASSGLFTYNFTQATGIAAGSNGTLDLTNISGGSYRVEATYSITGYTQQWIKAFIVAFPNDLSVAQIRSPLEVPRKYPRGVSIPVSARIQNVGLNDITNARVIATIKRVPDGAVLYRDTVAFTGTLQTGELSTIDFKTFNSLEVSKWSLQVCSELLSAADQQAGNDCLPTTGSYVFETKYNEEVGSQTIDQPSTSGSYISQRPFRPSGRIINGGIQDLSNIPVRMQIYQLPARTQVYNQLVVVSDVGAEAPLNITTAEFPAFTPPAAGQYEVCMTTEYPGDPVVDNNKICQVFTVSEAMSGTYTIGTTKLGQARNFPTIQDAVDTLYRKGVSGAVQFELTDAAYNIGSTLDAPALDLTTRVIGANATNTITFMPSLDRSLSKGSVTVTMNSGRGVGILFGQSIQSSNTNAVQFEFAKDPALFSSEGHFRFDGGNQKSLIFQLSATTPFRAPFYLGDGSKNIQLKNLIIRNAPSSTPSYAVALPTINFISNQFQYQADVRTVGATTVTYTAGIVSRQKIPTGRDGNNSEKADTIAGFRNVFNNNEISGFGYGIASMGVGLALKAGSNEYRTYYTTESEISDNLITNVRRAGIFVAYHDNVTISNNRIYNVGTVATGGSAVDAIGILAGGVARYHNVNLNIVGNEISGVYGDIAAKGIAVEQARNIFTSVGQAGTSIFFPSVPEATKITSNAIWGIGRTNVAAHLAGVHVYTMRDAAQTGINLLLQPALGNLNYFTNKDLVANNTIIIGNDNVANGTGIIAGVAVQHGNATTIKNNAIVMQGGANASTLSHSALYYQGVQMTDDNDPMALVSDYNAYELGNAGVARFVNITANTAFISMGTQTEFQTLSQWRAWTKRDLNSIEGPIFQDHVLNGIAPNQTLRVRTNPTPIASIINNRGERLSAITTDIAGAVRGAAGQLYDIGANEFNGRQYLKDLEVLSITSPSSYRSFTGANADAEYVMTTAPVNVTALIRNSGGLPQINTPIRVRIFLETINSNNTGATPAAWDVNPVVDKIVNTTVDVGQSVTVNFELDGFTPQAYQQLPSYTVPTRFTAMMNNVTPRYRIEIGVSFDENNTNNTISKDTRFFILRSQMHMLLSGASASVNINGTPTPNEVGGRLNLDSLTTGLRRLGFVNSPASSTIAYDLFDRTNWEDRAVNYTPYRTMFWSGDTTRLSYFQRRDVRMFMATGSSQNKKNLAMASQEYPRKHIGMDVINDQSFVNQILRVSAKSPFTPVPTSTTYNDKRVRGEAIARNSVELIVRTGFPADFEPNPALVSMYSDASSAGLALPAYFYVKGDRETANDSIMGSTVTSLNSNVVYFGLEWRHWRYSGITTGVDRVLRGTIDFFEKNGGVVVPVELTRFDAKPRGSTVDVAWSTASERNSDRFVIERSDAVAGNEPSFRTVGTVSASGNTTQNTDYTFRDMNVPGGVYLYRLMMADKDGSIDHSGAVQVVIGSDAIALEINNISPQPAINAATMQFTLASASHVRVELVNINGEVIATLFNAPANAGVNTVELPSSNLSSGTYTVVVSTPSASATEKFVVRK